MLFHIDPLRLWVHKVLPVVYDDSLSYYEVLAKVTKKLNEVIDLTEEQNQYIEEFSTNLTNAINNWEDGMEREWSSYKSGLNNEWGAFQRNTEQYIENWKNMAESDIEDAIAAGINQFVSYFSDLTQTAVDAAERAMEAAETAAEDAVDAIMPTLESQFDARYAWKTAVGSPLVATTAAGMTDTTKVYVYAGSETGYVNGDWYYYDGTAWQDGGVYNSAAVVTDPTLSESGVPADAKAAGDEIADLKSAIPYSLSVTCTDGDFIDPNGNTSSSANSCYTDYIPVFPGEIIKFGNLKLTGTRSICAYNSAKVKTAAIVTGSDATEYTVTVPAGAAYLRATGASGTAVTAAVTDIIATVKGIRTDTDTATSNIGDIKSAVGDYAPTLSKTDGKFINAAGNEDSATNSCVTDFIPVIPGQTVYLSGLKLTSARSVYGYTITKTPAKWIAGNSDATTLTYTVDNEIYYIRATGSSGAAPTLLYGDLIGAVTEASATVAKDSAFVATTGDDTTGDGTASAPYATLSRAIKSGAENIYISAGVYDEQINLADTPKSHLRIINASKDSKVVFKRADAIIATSETLVPGYTKVNSASTAKTYDTDNLWIYQDGVPDAATEIIASERHPAQKGYAYRCPDTKIVKCTATSQSDALAEIENSDEYKWFVNSGTIYFSRPQTVNATNPICADFGFTLFSNAQQYNSVEIYGIDTKYMRINLNDMKNAKAVDCSARNVFGPGAFTYSSRNTELIRCEAACCCNGTNGDGFNGAAALTGDADGSQTTTTLADCWAHDNKDDGYSDHNRSDAIMRGGLYEYNVKAGVTPSSGENFAAYDVLSRKNMRGFFLTTSIGDASKIPSAILYNCVAEDNTGRTDSSGFTINASSGSMTLVNCMTTNSPTGYRSETGSSMIMINCKAKDVTAQKGGSGTITVINGDIVT